MGKLGYLGSFVIGGGIGALVAWIFTRKKYEKLVNDEIKSVREEFSKESHIVVVKNEENAEKTPDNSKADLKNYQGVVKENHYTSYKQALEEVKKTAQSQDIIFPYLIEADEQGESGFAKETLIWYEGDSTLADETGKIIDQPDTVIGMNNLDDFGKNDVIYVRNETEEIDYEVIRDPDAFSETYSNPNYIRTGIDE